MSPERVRRKITVSGRVQGVSFRYYASERAQAHGVAGWVRNCSNGTVEAVLEGEPEAVDRLLRFFHTGPPHARVERVVVHDESPEGLTGFHVR